MEPVGGGHGRLEVVDVFGEGVVVTDGLGDLGGLLLQISADRLRHFFHSPAAQKPFFIAYLLQKEALYDFEKQLQIPPDGVLFRLGVRPCSVTGGDIQQAFGRFLLVVAGGVEAGGDPRKKVLLQKGVQAFKVKLFCQGQGLELWPIPLRQFLHPLL